MQIITGTYAEWLVSYNLLGGVSATLDKSALEDAAKDLEMITGRKPAINIAKKSCFSADIHFHLLMVCTSPSWFDTQEHVSRMRTFQNEANYMYLQKS